MGVGGEGRGALAEVCDRRKGGVGEVRSRNPQSLGGQDGAVGFKREKNGGVGVDTDKFGGLEHEGKGGDGPRLTSELDLRRNWRDREGSRMERTRKGERSAIKREVDGVRV